VKAVLLGREGSSRTMFKDGPLLKIIILYPRGLDINLVC
jgi:hypothetical protein